MEKQIITFSANEQKLQKTSGIDCYASNIVAYIEARFDLGDNWSGYDSVRAVWWNDYNKTVATVLDSDGTCVVPYEVLTRKSAVKVNLVGSIADGDVLTDRLTTCPVVALTIKCNAKTDGDNTQPITPSEYEQFVAYVKTDADRAEAGATASANSAQNASESATASANSASDSAQSAIASAQSAQNASESAITAENAKDDAEDARDKILSMRATAETLEAGSDATASYSDGLLTLGIPRGDKGVKGDTGETGATPNISIGTVETLAPTEDATATITGTAENPVLNLGLPKGDTGEVSLEDLEALLPTDTASGDIVTIPDGQSVIPAESLKVALEPIQDLNGYDKPWSGGAGKNKFNIADETFTLKDVTISSRDNVITIAGTVESGYPNKIFSLTTPLPAGTYTLSFTEVNAGDRAVRVRYEGGGYADVPSLPFTFTASAPVIGIQIGTNPNKTYNNDTISNIQIESGSTPTSWTPYSNICPISGRTECVTEVCGVNVWDEVAEVGGLNVNTGATTVANRTRSKNYIPCVPNTSYYWKLPSSSGLAVCYYDASKTFVSGAWVFENQAHTTPANANFMKFCTGDAYGTTYNNDISINYPSTDHDYHAYDGETYTTTLGRTVYGGTLDVVSGELVVDRVMVTKNTADMNNNEAYPGWIDHIWYEIFGGGKNEGPRQIMNIGNHYGINTMIENASALWLYTSDFGKTQTEWKSLAMDVQIVCRLATPQTIQLTPQEVRLLLGTNNIWSDGKVTLTYSADIQKWVEKKLSGNSTTLTMSRPMVQTETETETETTETEETE